MNIVNELISRAKVIYEVDITKVDAENLLNLPGAGRPLDSKKVEIYKAAIDAMPEPSETALYLILVKTDDTFHIVDGRHRLAGFCKSTLKTWKVQIAIL